MNRRLITQVFSLLMGIAGLTCGQEKSRTGFERVASGEITSVNTAVGTWLADPGHAKVTRQFARTGKNSLHLVGGKNRLVTLSFPRGMSVSDHRLTFWAERWTRKGSFEFRIEKFADGKWEEIYQGDRAIKVGRSFLSFITVDLTNPGIRKLRLRCSSLAGVLLDDFSIGKRVPMKISSIRVVQENFPILLGRKFNPCLELQILTTGSKNPLHVNRMGVEVIAEKFSDLKHIEVFAVPRNGVWSERKRFGLKLNPKKSTPPEGFENARRSGTRHRIVKRPRSQVAKLNSRFYKFEGNAPLREGVNSFWISCELSENANIDRKIGVSWMSRGVNFGRKDNSPVEQIAFSQRDGNPYRLGVALRQAGQDGVHTYRIPGLCTTRKGTLICVYDVRRRSGKDLPGDIDVGMSRSTDGGRTWEKMKIIMDMGSDAKFSFDGVGDPAILVDRKTGTLWCAATWSHGNRSWRGSGPGLGPLDTGQLLLVRSDDDGKTWSKPINITKQIKDPKWSFVLQGPGKGTSLSDGTIVFAAQYQDPPSQDKMKHRLPHSTIIYSRDHGKTWSIGKAAAANTTESQVVELGDGELMLNCRNNNSNFRIVKTSRDFGKIWQTHSSSNNTLIEPRACMASLINVSRELGLPQTKWLLFSNPNDPRRRRNISIKASPDQGKTWPKRNQLLLDSGIGAGYSCMTMIDSDTVGIVYEGSRSQLTFQRIPLRELTRSKK